MIRDTSPLLMARDMAAIYSDIGFIRAHVLAYFGRAPSREKIIKLREEHLAARKNERSRAVQSDEKRQASERRREIERRAAKRYRERKAAA